MDKNANNANMADTYCHDIPEGYEARIEGNKVFIERKVSEDEKIRKWLIEYVKCFVLETEKKVDKKAVLAWLEKQKEPEDKGEISDGYHTFNELYYYRMLYNAAFFNLLPKEWVHKSKRHHTGEECFGGGWFIVMADLPSGQISNHYELKYWDLFQIPEKEFADEWDGHTLQEAAVRLHAFLAADGYGMLNKQNSIKWSEKERERLEEIADYMQCKGCEDDADFLKSLQPRWEPTADQIEVLYKVLRGTWGGITDKACLLGLLHDLEKL